MPRDVVNMSPRYPEIHVELRSRNPYALISAVRLALRRSRIDRAEIFRFTEEALADDEPLRMRQVCDSWADVQITA